MISLLEELKKRRITQWLLSYLAAGWVALAVVDQLADRAVIPELAYRLALLVYAAGIPVALILGWYHGEKGHQKFTLIEVVLLALVFLGTAGSAVAVVNNYRPQERAVAEAFNSEHDPRRVAVLYFEDRTGGEGDLAHVADGLTEDLIGELSRVQPLDVLSRNAVAQYRDRSLPSDSVGRALGAGSVIDGSVEREGDRLRVNVRLLDAVSGADIERTGFTLPTGDLFAVRDSVVQRAGRFLRSRLGEEVRVRVRRAGTESVDAWTHLLRAERFRKEAEEARRTDPDRAQSLLARADSLLRRSEALDEDWAEPTVARAEIALRRGVWAHSTADAEAAVRDGVVLANRAIEKASDNAEAWEARGTLHYFHWFLNVNPTPEERAGLLDRAQEDLERAVELDPSLASAHNTLSRLYYERKDRISAALAARQAVQADAYLANADNTFDRLFWSHYDLGQFSEARRTCNEAAVRFPGDPRFKECQLWMMIAPTDDPEPEAAWELLSRVDSLTPPDRGPLQHRIAKMIVGGVLARANMPDSARSVLVDARVGPEVDPDQELYGYEAIMRTMLGDEDEAVQRLRRYVAANPHHSFIEVEGDLHWWWRPLRDHPGFGGVAAPGS